MKILKTFSRIATLVTFSLFLVSFALAQDRQIELNADLPAKRGLLTSDIALGGRVYLPAGNFTLVADIDFKDAINLFLAPTDQINVEGQVWYYLTGKPEGSGTKPFVFGGITRAMFLGQPVDSTTGLAGFGITYKRPSGFHMIPQFEFSSDDFESGRTVLGKSYAGRVYFHIPLNSSFNLNVTPRFARSDRFITGVYQTEYGITVGFARKF
jgi:hypothetical protein